LTVSTYVETQRAVTESPAVDEIILVSSG
jgi:hypothetical protein